MINLLITGSSGFLGKNLVNKFKKDKSFKNFAPSSKVCDCSSLRNLKKYIISNKINTIVHCAGFIGGINFSRIYPDKYFQEITNDY